MYAFSGGPYAAVILESEPLLKRDKSTQVFADAKLRWPRDACHAFRLRRATKVAVVPVSNANRRLSKRQAQDEALCLRLLESALRKRPWVFSRDSDAATLTSTRASDASDYALAERQALRQRGSIKAEDAARQRFERADAAFLWNQRVLAPVVCFGVGIMSRRRRAIDAAGRSRGLVDGVEGRGSRDADSAAHASRGRAVRERPRARTGPRRWRREHTQHRNKQTQVEAGAAAWCCACACIIATACDLGAVDDAEDEGPAPCAAIVLTRLGVDTGARLVRRGLGRDGSLSSYAETEVLVAAAATPDRPARAYAFTFEGITTRSSRGRRALTKSRGPAQAQAVDIEKGPHAATDAGQREAREDRCA